MPTASALFIDKIALTIALDDPAASDRISEWFHPSAIRTIYGYPVLRTRGGRFYSQSREIVFDAEAPCKLLAEYFPRENRRRRIREIVRNNEGHAELMPDIEIEDARRPLRLEWNPSQMLAVPEHQQAFLDIMRYWFGEALEAEIANATITRIDLATDINHLKIGDLVISRNDTTVTSTTYSRRGRIQTIYLGNKNTNLRFAIYDKAAQQGGSIERTRIEARIKKRLTFDSIFDYSNPFARLAIREAINLEIRAPGNSEFVWDWLIDSFRQRGGEAALNLVRNSRTRAKWRNKIAVQETPRWWDPQALWDDGLLEAIRRMGLHPRRRRPIRYRTINA